VEIRHLEKWWRGGVKLGKEREEGRGERGRGGTSEASCAAPTLAVAATRPTAAADEALPVRC
jgi:hypothetical protein